MPHVTFNKKRFLSAIGEESYSSKDIEDVFAKLGMEATVSVGETGEEEVVLEFCANRYDLSGMEGAVLEVRCFLGKEDPFFVKPDPPKIKFYVNGPAVRPYAVGAVLRGIHFDEALFRRFIDLQEKLHENACRHRQYVAIGTHNLDSIVPPFYYRGEEPSSVKFIPLKSTITVPFINYRSEEDPTKKLKPIDDTIQNSALFPVNPEFAAPDLYDFYEKYHLPLGKYTYLLKNAPAIAVIRDSNGVLLSLPPLVNGEHTRCSLRTENIFIDVTGTDENKVCMVINVIVTLFAKHCSSVEYVEIVHGTPETVSPRTELYPKVDPLQLDVAMEDINGLVGLSLTPEEAIPLLKRKQIAATVKSSANGGGESGSLHVTVPAHRADVMHSADIAEDVLIAYGVDNIAVVTPSFSITGSSLLAEDATEQIRQLGANNGYVEMYNFVLLSIADGFNSMLRPMCAGHCGNNNVMQKTSSLNPVLPPPTTITTASTASTASSSTTTSTSASPPASTPAVQCRCGIVSTLNGKSMDTEAVRLSLLPCLLKSLRNNNHHPKPTCLFEVGDVVVPDYAGCAYAFRPHTPGAAKRCEAVCGGGCCAAVPTLSVHNTLVTPAGAVVVAGGLAPNPYVAPLFEYPNTLGIIRADNGSRNERHFSAVRCGPAVEPENLIPVIARLLGNFRLLFNSGGEAGLTLSAEVVSKAVEEDPALRRVPDHVLNGVAGYWEMLPPAALSGTGTAQTSSYIRWVSDSASFIDNNFTLICVTLKNISSGAEAATGEEVASEALQLLRVPVGIMGILRPDVVKSFSVHTNVVAFELNLEPLYVRLL